MILQQEKLRLIRELEEDLEIDLVTLLKALKNGIWVRQKPPYNENEIVKLEPSELNVSLGEDYAILQELYFEDLDYVMDTTGRKWHQKDYGKTWALTEEELL